jgi:flagellar motor protein MotB
MGSIVKQIGALTCRALLLGSCVALTAGCVSQQKYDDLQTENSKLKQLNTVLTVQQRELFAVTVILSQEVELLDEQQALLAKERAELEIEMEKLLLAGNIRMELLKSGLNLILEEDVMFTSGSATIKPEGKQVISDLTAELEQVPYQVVVIGHTDNVPIGPNVADRFPSNWALAAARAAAVVDVMANEGLPRNQLVAVSFGDTQPIAGNDTPDGRAANRRIEVRLRPIIQE